MQHWEVIGGEASTQGASGQTDPYHRTGPQRRVALPDNLTPRALNKGLYKTVPRRRPPAPIGNKTIKGGNQGGGSPQSRRNPPNRHQFTSSKGRARLTMAEQDDNDGDQPCY